VPIVRGTKCTSTGKMGRPFNTRKKIIIQTSRGQIANVAWSHDHPTDLESASIIDKGGIII